MPPRTRGSGAAIRPDGRCGRRLTGSPPATAPASARGATLPRDTTARRSRPASSASATARSSRRRSGRRRRCGGAARAASAVSDADERALPDELQQRPADRLGCRLPEHDVNRAHHRRPPAVAASISFRISPSSSAVARLASSACMHELGRRPAERAIEQVAHELPLRLLLGQPRLIDVRAVGVVAPHQPLLRHDLEHLQRGGVGGRAARVRRATSWTCRTVLGAALPEDAQDGQLGIGRAGAAGFRVMARYYVRTPS